MIDPAFLEVLRCPIDPGREAPVVLEEHRVLCSRCRVRFPTRDGLINFLASDAVLPEGCTRIEQLPCRREQGPGKPPRPDRATSP
ncbi:MAG TPA: hypothetical protein VIL46_05855 [Gemmataceae bacterium]